MNSSAAFAALAEEARVACPEVALVLGSGMGGAALGLRPSRSVLFADIPGLAAAGVAGHCGRLTLGEWAGKQVLVFAGRLHFYEGHPWPRVLLPVRIARCLGARVLVATSAAGGIHEALAPGSLLALRDHIDWTQPYSWRVAATGGVAPSRASPYAPRLRQVLLQAAQDLGVVLHEGIYAAVTGPSYETPAEIRALKALGADAVGMSTAQEVQAGGAEGLECLGLSCITNRAAGLGPTPPQHDEVLGTAAAQSGLLGALLAQFLQLLNVRGKRSVQGGS